MDRNNVEFDITNINQLYDHVIKSFSSTFGGYGLMEHNQSSIISDIDKSTFFVGSTISVFKPTVIEKKIPGKGYFLIQKCLRTQNASILKNDEKFPEWSSYFTSIGTISPPGQLKEISNCIWKFFTDELKIDKERLLVRVSSHDIDMMNVWNNIGAKLEIDTREINYYRHHYGLQNVIGRNINFAIKQNNLEFKDVGNLIIIENKSGQLGVELAFGVGTLLSRIYQLPHPINASLVSKIVPHKNKYSIKFADALSVVVVLSRQGIRPTASENRGRILRKYLQSLSYFRTKLDYSVDEIGRFITSYEKEEFGNISDLDEKCVKYLKAFEKLTREQLDTALINKKISILFN
ncbi:MAG: hypothetical protein WC599_12500 [Bacteroidales bacterium]